MSPSLRRVWVEISEPLVPVKEISGSPSLRRVWVEIGTSLSRSYFQTESPSLRRVWVEIKRFCTNRGTRPSPSLRRVWVEIAELCRFWKWFASPSLRMVKPSQDSPFLFNKFLPRIYRFNIWNFVLSIEKSKSEYIHERMELYLRNPWI